MPYISSNALVRRSSVPPLGWDESLKKFQDWDFFLTMAEQGKQGIWVNELLFTVLNTQGTMSTWVPSFAYKLPWHWIGWQPQPIRAYNEAMAIIRQKHNIAL